MIRRAALGLLALLASCTIRGGEPWQRPGVSVLLLRSGLEPEWDAFRNRLPDGRDLRQEITLEEKVRDASLLLFQADVKHPKWVVEVNGRKVGELVQQDEPLVSRYPLPADLLRPGPNTVRVLAPKEAEDVLVGVVRIDRRGERELPDEAAVEVNVLEAGHGALPARLTIVDDDLGALAPLVADPAPHLAVRPGVVYTATGHAAFRLPSGRYTITASRGFEYGTEVRHLKLEPGTSKALAFTLRREVPTPRWIACDTHVHTLALSGHGDATLPERMATLAGEGVELPVATEHNQHASYREAAAKAGVERFLTPVDGNEVTSRTIGHFNAFPVKPGARVPDAAQPDRARLLESVRETGASVVVMNHPCDEHDRAARFKPFKAPHFDPATGADVRGYGYDAVELVNSGALRTDVMEPFRGWFALLNRGVRVVGVGSSDSHDVSRFIVGQARTYIAGEDAKPGALDVEAAARALREGRALVSFGLLVDLRVAERFVVGDLATGLGAEVPVTVRVFGPAWTHVDQVTLFANGIPIREEAQAGARTGGLKLSFTWRIPKPAHDVHLVALATGPGTSSLHWPIPRPYQPSSTSWTPRVLGATNPVWLDADGDGAYLAPRAIAQRLVDAKAAPSNHDEAVKLHWRDLQPK